MKNEFEIRRLIRESAEDIEIPEGLEPEQIKHKIGRKQKSRKNFYISYAASAAVLLAVCSLALFNGYSDKAVTAGEAAWGIEEAEAELDSEAKAADRQVQNAEQKELNKAGQDAAVTAKQQWETQLALAAQPNSDAGDLYRVASGYGEVYDSVVKAERWKYGIATGGIRVNEALMDGMFAKSGAEESAESEAVASGSMNQIVNTSASKEYSTTNLQTEGVDECDIIKTDGSYLYVVSSNKIYILDIQNGEPKEAAVVSLPSESASASIKEIYVDQGKMFVVSGEQITELKEVESKEYYTVTKDQTVFYTYSLENPTKPKLLGRVSQDGYYHTSRKIGDKVYLFTNKNVGESCYGQSRDSEGWIPLVDGVKVAYDCIYIPEEGANSLIIASMDINHPDEILDYVMIVNNYANVYVSTQAVYLYHTEYEQNVTTRIAKFSIKDGIIDAVSAASVNGSVTDTFAVNEKDGMLRILTNEYAYEQGSSLYILDKKLNMLGVLEGIAPGEDVYAARYLGDMAYFVTYRNMDPLFAADLSDPANPVILGELKITGYSEYLHMWEGDTMLGIGYETDPDTSAREGVKLSMFDVSDPSDLKVIDCMLISNADYSPAMDQYKTVLADLSANMIGFVVTDYSTGQDNTFLLFEYKEGTFHNLVTEEIATPAEGYRGVYAGDYFYIVSQKNVVTFSRTDGYKRLGEMEIN